VRAGIEDNLVEGLYVLPWFCANLATVCAQILFLAKRHSMIKYFDASTDLWKFKIEIEDGNYANKVGGSTDNLEKVIF
jgi:hypothetical protein